IALLPFALLLFFLIRLSVLLLSRLFSLSHSLLSRRFRRRLSSLWLLPELSALRFRRPIRIGGSRRRLNRRLALCGRLIHGRIRSLLSTEAPICGRIGILRTGVGLIHRCILSLRLTEAGPIHRCTLLIRIHRPEPATGRRRSGS